MPPTIQTGPPPRPAERDFLAALRQLGIDTMATVPCSITATFHDTCRDAALRGDFNLVISGHEANLPGMAIGHWLGSGKPALVHMQNSGLPNAADGFISFASAEVYAIPILALVTWRGDTTADDSEPHQAIGRRMEAICEAVFGAECVFGRRDGSELLAELELALSCALSGRPAALRLASTALSRQNKASLPAPLVIHDGHGSMKKTGGSSHPDTLAFSEAVSRDEALIQIAKSHPQAAMLFANGFTSRAAQALVDRPGNFYNAGYMGGTLAIGWALAKCRPDLDVVVVDGDQNAIMSCMKDQLSADYPPNLYWYILDNGIGASVGTAASLPLSALYHTLARVIRTIPDAPGSFSYPRISVRGCYVDEKRKDEASLAGLARGMRRWLEEQKGNRR
jgi:phosphonopyruvate decarboxylase